MMTNKIIEYANNLIKLTDEEAEQLSNAFQEVSIKKRQFIVQPNFTAKNRYYVVKGTLMAYVVTDEGHNHTITFAIDDWWITDYNSYIFQQPATMFIVALEDTVVLQIDHEKEHDLKRSNHKFETFFRIMAERGLASHQRRIISNLTQSAEERYENYARKYPQIVQRVPQYALASYLGMTTEFLSRIRNKRVAKKS